MRSPPQTSLAGTGNKPGAVITSEEAASALNRTHIDSFFQMPSETTASRKRVGRDGDGGNSEAPRPASKPKAPAADPEKRTASAPAPARVEISPPI